MVMNKERELLLVALDFLSTVGWGETDRFAIVALAKNIRELLAQPEQDDKTTYIGETQWMQVPEPLSDRLTAKMFNASKKATSAACYWAGVSDAEKHHGIGAEL